MFTFKKKTFENLFKNENVPIPRSVSIYYVNYVNIKPDCPELRPMLCREPATLSRRSYLRAVRSKKRQWMTRLGRVFT